MLLICLEFLFVRQHTFSSCFEWVAYYSWVHVPLLNDSSQVHTHLQ